MDQKNLELLMEYQSLDKSASRFDEELRKSPARASLVKAQKYLVNVQNSLKQLESQVEVLLKSKAAESAKFASLKEEYSQISAEISAEGTELPMEELASLRGSLQDVYNELGDVMQKIKSIMDELSGMDDKLKKMAASVPKAKSDYTNSKTAYDKEVERAKNNAAPFREKMAALEGSIPAPLLSKYKNVRKNHSQPLAALKDGRCMGCNMELSVGFLNRVATQDLIECENCGRILYIEK